MSTVPPAHVEGESDPRPVVALPREGLPGAAIAGIAAVAALLLFVGLDTRRRASEAVAPMGNWSTNAFAPPPALVVPSEPLPPRIALVTDRSSDAVPLSPGPRVDAGAGQVAP